MLDGSGLQLGGMKRLIAHRSLLNKRIPFDINKANGFIKSRGKKYKIKKLSPAQLRLIRIKVNRLRSAEKKRLIVTSALTILITAVVIAMSTQLTKFFF